MMKRQVDSTINGYFVESRIIIYFLCPIIIDMCLDSLTGYFPKIFLDKATALPIYSYDSRLHYFVLLILIMI